MPTIDLPLNLVHNMLNQAATGEQLLGILEAVVSPDEDDFVTEDVIEEDEDPEPTVIDLDDIRDEVVMAILETEDFDPVIIEQELAEWDHIPADAFVTC